MIFMMTYKKEDSHMQNSVFRKVEREYNLKRQRAQSDAKLYKKNVYDENPILQEIEDEINIISLKSAKARIFSDELSRKKEQEKLEYKYAKCKETGCPPYNPRIMLNLYIYGYLNRINSSRRLRDEARRNIEAMWLIGGLKPDDKTICNFRKDNAKALR